MCLLAMATQSKAIILSVTLQERRLTLWSTLEGAKQVLPSLALIMSITPVQRVSVMMRPLEEQRVSDALYNLH